MPNLINTIEALETRRLLAGEPLLFKDFIAGSLSGDVGGLTDFYGTLFLSATDGENLKLWKTDGTVVGRGACRRPPRPASGARPSSD